MAKVKVNLKTIRNPLDNLNKALAKGLKKPGTNKKGIRKLRKALRRVRRALAAECCDNVWFCEF